MNDPDVDDLLTISELYTSGEIHLEEAMLAMSSYMSGDDAFKLLTSLTRDNVIKFPEPRFEDVEELTENELTDDVTFTFTPEFDLDDPA